MTLATHRAAPSKTWQPVHLLALLGGNIALALGPLWVRLADTGPVAAGFWRLALAVPLIALLARVNRQRLGGFSGGAMLAVLGAGMFFALDLSSWHVGIELTRLGNATLFGNSGSILLVIGGLIALRRAPRPTEWLAFAAALIGSAILLGRSLEIDRTTLNGDLLCLLAGVLYTGYIMLIQRARSQFGSWSLLFWASLAGCPVLLGIAVLRGEPVLAQDWTPVLALALTSQVLGQGLLVYALRHFTPVVIGFALLTQPAVSVAAGWLVFGEVLSPLEGLGIVLVAAALALSSAAKE